VGCISPKHSSTSPVRIRAESDEQCCNTYCVMPAICGVQHKTTVLHTCLLNFSMELVLIVRLRRARCPYAFWYAGEGCVEEVDCWEQVKD
jgi:hypothetical protein